ncbi:MAG: amidase, partial [Frankiales bacterium]|nr:amidase [Frankiales bacterium]
MDTTLSPDDVAYAGLLGQRALLREGRLSAVELLGLCLARIDALDGRLNAFCTLFREGALAEAQAADAALAVGDDRPLLGVPVAVKDTTSVAGHGAAFGTGSPELAAAADSELVRRLRAAGAVVVGTTHTPELALWPFTESATFGATRNPWDPTRTPGGSSGGSAAAVASGMVAFATASDGGGSIRVPAACCGLTGLKPTRGRVPLAPEAEGWLGLSSSGVLARSPQDVAAALEVLFGEPLPLPDVPPLRIAWSVKPATPAPVQDVVKDAVARTVAALQGHGHTLVQADPSYAGVQESFLVRYARGVRDDLVRLVDPSRTELRTRVVAALGARLGERAVARARRLG